MGMLLRRRALLALSVGPAPDPDPDPGGLPEDVAAIDWHALYWADDLDLGDDDPVAQWDDLSGHGHHLTQATAASQPTFVEALPAFNDRAAVKFDVDILDVDFTALSQPNTIVLIARTAMTSGTTEYGSDASNQAGANERHIIGLVYGGDRAIHAGSWITGNPQDVLLHLYVATFDGATSELKVDDTVEASGNAGTRSLRGLTLGGAYTHSDHFLAGEIAFAGVVDGTLTEAEKDALHAFAVDHYGVGVVEGPSDIGLIVHLDADDLTLNDDDPVTVWSDLSGEGNDAKQGTAERPPTFKTGILNGLPVVRFAGNHRLATDLFTGGTVDQPTTIVVVASCDQNDRGFMVDGSDAGTSNNRQAIIVNNSTNQLGMWAGSHSHTFMATPFSHKVIIAEFSGSSSEMWVDGVSHASGDAGSNSLPMLTLGERGHGDDEFSGDVAEVLVYDRALTAEERSALTAHLAGKYGL